MKSLKREELHVIYAIMLRFQEIFEKSKELLVCKQTSPAEKNAYFALSNAVFIESGRKYSLAATELNLGGRVVDVAFVLGKTLYLVELKTTIARITGKDFREGEYEKNNRSTRKAIDIVEQLEGIVYESRFFERLRELHGVQRVVGVGVVVGNLRALDSATGNIKKTGIARSVVESVGDKWTAASESHVAPGYKIILRKTSITSLVRSREAAVGQNQYEVGSSLLVFAKRFV